MKAIYLRDLPLNIGEFKSRNPRNFSITGSAVYCWDVFTALFRFSSYDSFLLPTPARSSKPLFLEGTIFNENRDRISFLTPSELFTFRDFDKTVVFQNSADLHIGARLRRMSGCADVPVTGVVHSLNYRHHLSNTARLL